MIRIIVDGAPVAKGRGRIGRINGRPMVFTPAKTRTYADALAYAASQAMIGKVPLDVPLSVEVTAFLPIPVSFSKKKRAAAAQGLHLPSKKPDVDNYLKQLDALNTIVWRDDALIVVATIRKVYAEKPRLEIEVREAVQDNLL